MLISLDFARNLFIIYFFLTNQGHSNYVMQGTQQLVKDKDGKVTVVAQNNGDNDNSSSFNADSEFDKDKVMNIIKASCVCIVKSFFKYL